MRGVISETEWRSTQASHAAAVAVVPFLVLVTECESGGGETRYRSGWKHIRGGEVLSSNKKLRRVETGMMIDCIYCAPFEHFDVSGSCHQL
jgi:hypothetical protein